MTKPGDLDLCRKVVHHKSIGPFFRFLELHLSLFPKIFAFFIFDECRSQNFYCYAFYHILPIALSMRAPRIVWRQEIWSLPSGASDTISHGQSIVRGIFPHEYGKNEPISSKSKCYLEAHSFKLMRNVIFYNTATNTPCFFTFPVDLTWQPVWAWHHSTFWNRGIPKNDGGTTAPWLDWIGLDLFNDDTHPSGHISNPSQVGFSHSCLCSTN